MANVTLTRRQNVVVLFQAYAEKALGSGASPKGLEQDFATSLQISPSMWSQIKSSRPIGDKLARQIDVLSGKAPGWLDEIHVPAVPTEAEEAFVALAQRAWRDANAAGKRRLRHMLLEAARANGVKE
jgi:hypothetical protein